MTGLRMMAALLGAPLLLVAATPVRAAEPYEIHMLQALTGAAAFLGKGVKQAVEVAEGAINASGGIKGRPVKFIFHDDQTSPQIAVQLVTDIIAQKPAVILGSTLVAQCRAMAPLMKDGPVDYCFSPGIHPEAGSYVFTSGVSTLDLATALVRYFRLRGLKRIALMFSTDASGQDAEQGLKSIFALPENKEMAVVETAHFNTTDVSVSAQIEGVKAAQPQAFIAWSTGTPIGTIFRAIEQAALDIPIATTDGNMTHAQMTQYAAFLPKEIYFTTAPWVIRDAAQLPPAVAEKNREFYRAFDAIGVKPDLPTGLAWDPPMILVNALRTLGPDASATQVRDYMIHLKNYAGLNGIYDFEKTPQRGIDVTNAVVTRWSAAEQSWKVVSQAGGAPLP